jgi:hypothetical protein
MKSPVILFLLKRRHDYNAEKHANVNVSTGLYNSAAYMHEMLLENNIQSHIKIVVDNNAIDAEVYKVKPTHVIIEALWVTPSKFNVLTKLYPNIKWIIRLHSEIPFLSNEGMAFDWIAEYMQFENIIIATNAKRTKEEIKNYIKIKNRVSNKQFLDSKIIYLPNYYPQNFINKKFIKDKEYIDIACFGAVRPLKNHIIQAMAALKFADEIGKKLNFHINIGRVEQKGDSIMNNLQSIFEHVYDSGHRLIGHMWSPRENFIDICKNMDIGMQVSLSETFNIVAADLVSQGIPIVTSKEIPWTNPFYEASPTNSEEIYKKLLLTYNYPAINYKSNQYLLRRYTNKTKKIWLEYFKNK